VLAAHVRLFSRETLQDLTASHNINSSLLNLLMSQTMPCSTWRLLRGTGQIRMTVEHGLVLRLIIPYLLLRRRNSMEFSSLEQHQISRLSPTRQVRVNLSRNANKKSSGTPGSVVMVLWVSLSLSHSMLTPRIVLSSPLN
jgi:hypothetical protein